MGGHRLPTAAIHQFRLLLCTCPRTPRRNTNSSRNQMNLLKKLPPFDRDSGNLNVIIDTPKGCRSKLGTI
jgi:hypothetical protein